MALSSAVFRQAIQAGHRLKLMDLPGLTVSQLRGLSIVSNDRKHSWKWWDSEGGQKYQALCEQKLSDKKQTILYFFPVASSTNEALRKQYAKQIIEVMRRQRDKGIQIRFHMYQPDDLYAHYFAQRLEHAARCEGHDSLDVSDLDFDKLVFGREKRHNIELLTSFKALDNSEEAIFTNDSTTRQGSLIDMVICDSNYCQIKVHHLSPCHTVDQAERWAQRFDVWMQDASCDFDSLAKAWAS